MRKFGLNCQEDHCQK